MSSRIFVRGAAGLPFLACLAVAAKLIDTPIELRWVFRERPTLPVAPADYGPEEVLNVVASVPAPGAPLLEFLPLSEGVERLRQGEDLRLLGIWGPDPLWLSLPDQGAWLTELLLKGLHYPRGLVDVALVEAWVAEHLQSAVQSPGIDPESIENLMDEAAPIERIQVLAAPYAQWRRRSAPTRPLARVAPAASDPRALPARARPFLPHTGLFCQAKILERSHEPILRFFEALGGASGLLARQAARVAQLALPQWGVPILVAEAAWLELQPRLHPTAGAREPIEAYIAYLDRAGGPGEKDRPLPDSFFYAG